jgi:predicted MFS family arabinose efflux permease
LVNVLAALFLIFFGHNLASAFAGLLIYYMTFEFTLVSSMPMMTELLPTARASLLAANIAFISVSRALGDLVAPLIYRASVQILGTSGIGLNAIAAILLDLLALGLLFVIRSTRHNNDTFRY